MDWGHRLGHASRDPDVRRRLSGLPEKEVYSRSVAWADEGKGNFSLTSPNVHGPRGVSSFLVRLHNTLSDPLEGKASEKVGKLWRVSVEVGYMGMA